MSTSYKEMDGKFLLMLVVVFFTTPSPVSMTMECEWVQDNFKKPDFTIVNINTSTNSWKDMLLISNCAHHINSNGSFSWWSAWLNKNKDKVVIVPKNFMVNRYFEDIYPEGWIQFEKR